MLVVGSSNPVRDLDLAPSRADPPTVYANRGLAGIDGTVSTALGVALAVERPDPRAARRPDALHDPTGLSLGPAEPRPDLRLVVANDDGGSIFATLEQGAPAHAAAFERLFGTPHRRRLRGPGGGGRDRLPPGRADRPSWPTVLAEPPVGIELVEAVVDRARPARPGRSDHCARSHALSRAGGEHVVLVVLQHPLPGRRSRISAVVAVHRLGEPALRVEPARVVVAPAEAGVLRRPASARARRPRSSAP